VLLAVDDKVTGKVNSDTESMQEFQQRLEEKLIFVEIDRSANFVFFYSNKFFF